MNPFATLAKANRTLHLVKKANPSQALGGIIIPDRGTHSQIIDVGIDPDNLVKNGFKANVWAYACVDRLASAVSQVLWKVEKRVGPGDNDWEPDPNDWRQRLLNYPMGDDMSGQEVFYYFAGWLAIKGNGLLRKIPGGPNGWIELWPMTPKNVVPVPDRAEWCLGYNIMEDGKIIWTYPAEEVIHARLPDPSDPMWGFGMLEAASAYIDSDNASAKLRRENYKNGGVPPYAVIDEDLSDPLSAEVQAAALRIANRRAATHRDPMLLGGKKQITEFGFSPDDMEITSDRELTRDEIVTAFGMLPAMFSNDAATYDNQDGAIRFMYENGAGRLIAATEDALNISLLTKEERESDTVYIRPDMSRIPFFRRQREAKIAGMGTAIQSGISRNDYVALSELGLEPAEGGDAIFVGGGMVLLSEAAAGIASPTAASASSDPFAGEATPTPDVGTNLPQSQDVQVTQDAVLNGAQITAATAIVQAVAVGDLPRDAGIGQLMVLFNLEQSQAELMMGSAGQGFVAQSTVAPPPSTVPSVQPTAE